MIVVIPIAGFGTRFPLEIWKNPKPMIKIHNLTLLEYSVRSMPVSKGDTIVFAMREDSNTRAIISLIKVFCHEKDYKIVLLDKPTKGQGDTVYQALNEFSPDERILIHNGDTALNWSPNEMDFDLDGCLVTFSSSAARWSYVRINQNNEAEQVAEKNPISNVASTGTYYFKRLGDYRNAFENSRDFYSLEDEIYVAPLYNYLIERKMRIGTLQCNEFFCLGTPEDLESNRDKLIQRWDHQW